MHGILFYMSKKKKNRQNEGPRVKDSSKGDKAKRAQKMNGHLLLARNEAAAALLRAAVKEIGQNKVPEVKRCNTSMEAFRQFLSFSGMFWKSLFRKVKTRSGSAENEAVKQERSAERLSAAAKACGKSFAGWIGLLFAEIWTVIVLAFEVLFRSVWKFICWCGFQIGRLIRAVKERFYWKKLKYNIKYRARKEDMHQKNAERKAERKELQAKRREEAEFRKAMKAEEEAFLKAKRKEEEAIRLAKERRDEASRMTERIEAELAALALKRKEEEEKVLQETMRKEEALAALTEASLEEEAERERLEERRRIEDEVRIEAEKQEAEALKRLEQMQIAEDDRIRRAEAERIRLEEELARLEETKEPEPELPAEPEQGQQEKTDISNETAVPAEPAASEAEPEVSASAKSDAEAAAGKASEPETNEPEIPVPAEETSDDTVSDAVSEQLVEELIKAEETYKETKKKKPAAKPIEKAAIAASAAHNAVRSLPVHIPTITVPENLDAKELITEARDSTNGIIYTVVKKLEADQASVSIKSALIAGAAKYSLIGIAMALCAMIGSRRGNSGAGYSFGNAVIMFLVIAIVGTVLSAAVSYLSGMLAAKKSRGTDIAVFLRENARYTPISTLAYVICALIMTFSKEKFVAVLVAVILLSMIGHMLVMFREKNLSKGYAMLIYLLCIIIGAAIVSVVILLFRGQLGALWHALP